MFLEDQVWPKRCGHMKGKRVIPVDEQVQKIRAAVDARRGRDFFIVARTDARQVTGLADAISRCRQYYKDAGADALFVEAPRSAEPRGTEAYLKQYVEGPSGEPAGRQAGDPLQSWRAPVAPPYATGEQQKRS